MLKDITNLISTSNTTLKQSDLDIFAVDGSNVNISINLKDNNYRINPAGNMCNSQERVI